MWKRIPPSKGPWSLAPTASPESGRASASDATKHAHELRLLNLLLPTIFEAPPAVLVRRESPDFEVVSDSRQVFIEIVDAVPDVVTKSGKINLAQRRSRVNAELYRVSPEHFAETIVQQIEFKRRKARTWIRTEPQLQGRLVLFVNGGQCPLPFCDYAAHPSVADRLASISVTDPFCLVVVGDESGGMVTGKLP